MGGDEAACQEYSCRTGGRPGIGRFDAEQHGLEQPSRRERARDPAQRLHARTSFPMNVYRWEGAVLDVLRGTGEPRSEPLDALRFHNRITNKYHGDYAADAEAGPVRQTTTRRIYALSRSGAGRPG